MLDDYIFLLPVLLLHYYNMLALLHGEGKGELRHSLVEVLLLPGYECLDEEVFAFQLFSIAHAVLYMTHKLIIDAFLLTEEVFRYLLPVIGVFRVATLVNFVIWRYLVKHRRVLVQFLDVRFDVSVILFHNEILHDFFFSFLCVTIRLESDVVHHDFLALLVLFALEKVVWLGVRDDDALGLQAFLALFLLFLCQLLHVNNRRIA